MVERDGVRLLADVRSLQNGIRKVNLSALLQHLRIAFINGAENLSDHKPASLVVLLFDLPQYLIQRSATRFEQCCKRRHQADKGLLLTTPFGQDRFEHFFVGTFLYRNPGLFKLPFQFLADIGVIEIRT